MHTPSASDETAHRPHIVMLSTGGTIAGQAQSGLATDPHYTAGLLSADELIASVPDIATLADIRTEQIADVDSKDMSDDIWLRLAKRINQLLSQDDVDGIVVTHGTDTLEETAYFLHLTVSSHKPVVLTAAMRPATALSADGPANLYQAMVTASAVESHHQGVLVAINDRVLGARDITKSHTTALQAITTPNSGVQGSVYGDAVHYLHQSVQRPAQPAFTVDHLQSLPKVGIVYGYAEASPIPITAFVAAQFDGIVCAGVGQGNLHANLFSALHQAHQAGLAVVRSSRIGAGAVHIGAADDNAPYLIASGTLNPQKSRVLLMLALTKNCDFQELQALFQTY